MYNKLFQYDVPTPWDISTGEFEKESPSLFVPGKTIRGCLIAPDGNNFYTCRDSDNTIKQWSLTVQWDVEEISDPDKSIDISSEDISPYNVRFKPDGSKMYLLGTDSNTVYQYSLSTPWDVSTAVYEGKFKCVIPEETTPKDLAFKEDGTALYIIGPNADKVFQYTLLPHTSQYPPAQSDTYVKATTRYDDIYYWAYFATDPTKSLTGTMQGNSWLSAWGVITNQRFHIDLGSAKIIKRIYYENEHHNGGGTNVGVENFTFWGSNTEASFLELTYSFGPDVLIDGTPTADTEYDVGYEATKACDDNLETRWISSTSAFPHWWKYDLGAGVTKIVTKLRIYKFGDTAGCPLKDFTLQGSNNNEDWTTIHTGQVANVTTPTWEEFTFSNAIAYRYYLI
ncbi:unnamed protein product, partial [marine sediment metagenome]